MNTAPAREAQVRPPVPIIRYPTRLHCRCAACGHQGQVKAFLDKPLRLVCTKCGSRDGIVVTRDRLRVWAKMRRTRA